MPSYKPPLNDISFILNDVLKATERTKDIPSCAVAEEDVAMVLEAAADYATKIAFPLNQSGDAEGCTYNTADSSVKTPKGFKAAYDAFRQTGMVGLEGSLEHGGAGMPHYVGVASAEIITSANFSLATYAGLTGGAAKVLEKFATDEIKQKFLPLMYAGDITGTMCLTEPQAGSDLSAIVTKAAPNADGSYAVSGNKIFITAGEHDLAGNIVHLVLARLPDAPEGIKGISLFLVPKNDMDTKAANGVKCTGIEHKMGINGSATCSISFENSKGFLIGKPNEGMKAMFTMMNDARLKVGIQGLSISEVAMQNAEDHASNVRVQGKLLKDSFNDKAKPVKIINHPNIRRDIIDFKSQIEGFRALAYETAIQLDIAEKHPDEKKRKTAEDYTSLLTPVLKSCMTELSCIAAQKGIQLHGGMGFIRETGVEQYYRDALIGTIYEGTNDVQGIDFTFRKVLDPKNTSRLQNLAMQTMKEIAVAKANPALKEYAEILEKSMMLFGATAQNLGKLAAAGKLDDVLIHSRDFMDMFGKIAVGGMWLKIMKAADEKAAADPGAKEYCETRKALGDNFLRRIMAPGVKSLEMRIKADTSPIHKIKFSGQNP